MQKYDKTQNQYHSVIEFAKSLKNRKINLLEVGAANMRLKNWLPPNIEYHSMDFGSQHNPSLNSKNEYTYLFDLDSGNMPIKDEKYDCIVCFETLEHVMYPDRVMKELKRISKRDAIFFLSLPNEYNFVQRIYYLFGHKTYCDEPFQIVEKHLHIHKPRVEDITTLFGKYVLIQKVEYLWQSTKLPNWLDKSVNLIAQIFPSLFSRMVIVSGKKRA